MSSSTNISAGVLESYCLGLLSYEERSAVEQEILKNDFLKQQVEETADIIEAYLMANAVAPPAALKSTLFENLSNLELEEAKDFNRLPLINKYSNHNSWLTIINPLLPQQEPNNIFVKELRNDGKIAQILLWAVVDYPDEVHHDEEECFIVLKGKCRCYINEEVFELGPGDFLEIPLHCHHNVQVLEPVIAVVQRKKVA
jgi:mannose-6-phosphate isomerase-like protein (cupin superfamily)